MQPVCPSGRAAFFIYPEMFLFGIHYPDTLLVGICPALDES